MSEARLPPARRAGSRRRRPGAILLAAPLLLLAAPLLLISDIVAAETPASDAAFPKPLAPPARSRDEVLTESAVAGTQPGVEADAAKEIGRSNLRQSGETGRPRDAASGLATPAQASTTSADASKRAAMVSAEAPGATVASLPAAASRAASAPASPSASPPAPRMASLSPPAAPPSLRDALRAPPAAGAGRAHYRSIIEKETARTGLPADIAEAVMAVESGFNPAVIGAAGEIGLMQLMPPTARMLGFSGALTDLAQPEVNIHYGVTYLSQAWRLAGGDLCTAVMKYRAGHAETRFSQLSVNYCLAVRSKLAARGYPVTGSVPVATFGELTRPFIRASIGGGAFVGPPRFSLRGSATPRRSDCLAQQGGGRPNFDQINDSLNHLVLQSNVRAIRLH